jgi:hypothetical protein
MLDLATRFPSVEALVLNTEVDRTSSIEHFPNIKVLSTLFFDPTCMASTYPVIIHNLTHLQVPRIYSGEGHTKRFTLPNLHTFSIDFATEYHCRQDTQGSELFQPGQRMDCLDWSLPKLTNLRCFGTVKWYSAARVVEQLVERFGYALEGLSMTVRARHLVPTQLPEALWELCPNLSTIHTFLRKITWYIRPPWHHPTLRLIFCDYDHQFTWEEGCYSAGNGRWHGFEATICLLLALKCPIEAFEMDISWHTLKSQLITLHCYHPLHMVYNSLDQIKWGGKDLKDRYGEGMQSKSGTSVINWLRSAKDGPNRKNW